MVRASSAAIACAIAASFIASTSVDARIVCRDGAQIIPGVGRHATPYCEHKYLAKVARSSYGIATSFAKIRSSIFERERVCQAIGHDHRVYSTCLEFRPENNRVWNN